MYSIDQLELEHENINRVNDVIQAISLKILHGEEVPVEDLRKMVEFIRDYGDAYHHGKEEEILSSYMLEHLGPVAEKLVRSGMYVEHDQGRALVLDLEAALNEYETNPTEEGKLEIMTNALGYRRQLRSHIDKENDVVYPFAVKNLPAEVLEKVEEETRVFNDKNTEVREKYTALLEELEKKYDLK